MALPDLTNGIHIFEYGTSYVINADTTIRHPCVFQLGARLQPAQSVTVTLDADIDAPQYAVNSPIFDVSATDAKVILTTTGSVVANWWSGSDASERLNAAIDCARAAKKIEWIGQQDVQHTVHAGQNFGIKGSSQRRIPLGRIYDFSGGSLVQTGTHSGALWEQVGARNTRMMFFDVKRADKSQDRGICDVGVLDARNSSGKAAGEKLYFGCTINGSFRVANYYNYRCEGVVHYSSRLDNAHEGGAAGICTKWNDADESENKKAWNIRSAFTEMQSDTVTINGQTERSKGPCNNLLWIDARPRARKAETPGHNPSQWPDSNGCGLFFYHAARIGVIGGFSHTEGKAAYYFDQSYSGTLNGLAIINAHTEGSPNHCVYFKGRRVMNGAIVHSMSGGGPVESEVCGDDVKAFGMDVLATGKVTLRDAEEDSTVNDIEAARFYSTNDIDLSGADTVTGWVCVGKDCTLADPVGPGGLFVQQNAKGHHRLVGSLNLDAKAYIETERRQPPAIPDENGRARLFVDSRDHNLKIAYRKNNDTVWVKTILTE